MLCNLHTVAPDIYREKKCRESLNVPEFRNLELCDSSATEPNIEDKRYETEQKFEFRLQDSGECSGITYCNRLPARNHSSVLFKPCSMLMIGLYPSSEDALPISA